MRRLTQEELEHYLRQPLYRSGYQPRSAKNRILSLVLSNLGPGEALYVDEEDYELTGSTRYNIREVFKKHPLYRSLEFIRLASPRGSCVIRRLP